MTIYNNIQRNAQCSSSRSNIAEHRRLRLRDWLEMRIGHPRYPGLVWENKAQKIFRIPWKHGARHGWREDEDARLFREWSEHTGASPRDVKQHKANFRCALNSLRDVYKLTNLNKSKGDDAYRVYQMLPKSQCKSNKKWIRKRKVSKRENQSLFEAENPKFLKTEFPKQCANFNNDYLPVCVEMNHELSYYPNYPVQDPNKFFSSSPKYTHNAMPFQRQAVDYPTPLIAIEPWQSSQISVADRLGEAATTVMQVDQTQSDYLVSFNAEKFNGYQPYIDTNEQSLFNSCTMPSVDYSEIPAPFSIISPNDTFSLHDYDYQYMSDDSHQSTTNSNPNTHNSFYSSMPANVKQENNAILPQEKMFLIGSRNNQDFGFEHFTQSSVSQLDQHSKTSYQSPEASETNLSSLCYSFKVVVNENTQQALRESVVCSSSINRKILVEPKRYEDLSVRYPNSDENKLNLTNHHDPQSFNQNITIKSVDPFCEVQNYSSESEMTKKLPSASTLLNKCFPTKSPCDGMSPAVVYGR